MRSIYTILCLLISFTASAQSINGLSGFWTATVFNEEAVQQFELQIYKSDTGYTARQSVNDWLPHFGLFEVPMVKVEDTLIFNTGQGKCKAIYNGAKLEIKGDITTEDKSLKFHARKHPAPPRNSTISEVTVKNQDITLFGHLHESNQSTTNSLIILVGGRGCSGGDTSEDLWAKYLAPYGISVLSYNKRGTGKSTGDCSVATNQLLAEDLAAIIKHCRAEMPQYKNVGLLTSSAGGWVAADACNLETVDFLITMNSPFTTIREQQYQSMYEGGDALELGESGRANIKAYTDLMYDGKTGKSTYDKMQKLLSVSHAQGWSELLDLSDIPKSPEGIDSLWVRRFKCDPSVGFQKMNGPVLACFGQWDWIVPLRSNQSAVESIFMRKGNPTQFIIAPQAGHSMEIEPVTESDFFETSVRIRLGVIAFLREHKLIQP